MYEDRVANREMLYFLGDGLSRWVRCRGGRWAYECALRTLEAAMASRVGYGITNAEDNSGKLSG
jgi:hypothetical protein